MTEADLQPLGVHRIPIPVPFPQAGGPVNSYLVEEEDGGLLMFDSGLGTPDGVGALEAGFSQAGRRFEEVRRIVLSHGHVDHYGGAFAVLERAGRDVPVLAHPADVDKVCEGGRGWADMMRYFGPYLRKLGVPADMVRAIDEEMGGGFTMARRLARVTPLPQGEVLRTRHLELEVHYMPGHTPGLLCLYDRRHRLFLAGDHLLEKTSPNPIIELGPAGEEGLWKPLVTYVESLARLHALEVDLVLPGHGPAFGGHREIIDGLLAFYGKRQDRIREVLASGPRTAYEVTRELFRTTRPGDLFLVVSETLANVEVLESRGEVTRALEGGLFRFGLAA